MQPRTRAVKAGGRAPRAKAKNRLATLSLQPQRVEEIQRALVDAGVLHEEPTGKWDAQTREAMKRYQESNGFPMTGLPDAKSLMKLGLGPHPLPPELDHGPDRASLQSSSE